MRTPRSPETKVTGTAITTTCDPRLAGDQAGADHALVGVQHLLEVGPVGVVDLCPGGPTALAMFQPSAP